jgi:hypothetical protein
MEAQPLLHPLCPYVGFEYRLHHRQIHPSAGEMLMRQRDFHRDTALRAADIHK